MFPWLRLALFLLVLIPAQQGRAHLLNMSNVTVELSPGQQLRVLLTLDLMLEAGSRDAYYTLSTSPQPLHDPAVQQLLAKMLAALVLESDGVPVPLAVQDIRFAALSRDEYLSPLAWPRAEITLVSTAANTTLATAGELRIRFLGSFRFEEPIATTFLVTQTQRSMTRWLVAGQVSSVFSTAGWTAAGNPAQPVGQAADESSSLRAILAQYLVLGYQHILPEGVDHLLFVLGLCLGSESLRRLVVLITLFTVAHTLALGAVSLGLIPSSPRIVEPLILLTIIWIALENLRPRMKLQLRAALVLAFGLIHGMGFAGALKTIGLPGDAFLTALLGFNVGVELAQLTFICFVMLLLHQVRQRSWYRVAVVRGGSSAIAATGLFWMAQLFI